MSACGIHSNYNKADKNISRIYRAIYLDNT